jgi:hypothetical protein
VFSSSHLIFDGFSGAVLKDKVYEYYFSDVEEKSVDQYFYNDYNTLLTAHLREIQEKEIIDVFKLYDFIGAVQSFGKKYKDVVMKEYVYEYENAALWGQLDENDHLKLSQKVYQEALNYFFSDDALPVLYLNMARMYQMGNFNEYMGLFLDLAPIVISRNTSTDMWKDLECRLDYLKKNNTSFATLLSKWDPEVLFPEISELFSGLENIGKNVLIYNYLGIHKETTDRMSNKVFELANHRPDAYITDAVITDSGFIMKVFMPIDDRDGVKRHLDTMIERYLRSYTRERNHKSI